MNDNDNIKELIGARLEAIHMAETLADTMPSDEEILRWEALANSRRAQKQRKKRRLLSLAAVFLLAIVVGVAVIVSPPDAEAGGDGRAVIVDRTGDKDLEVVTYASMDTLPNDIEENYFFFDKVYGLDLIEINCIEIGNTYQVETWYHSNDYGVIEVLQFKSEKGQEQESNLYDLKKREKWGDTVVFVANDEKSLNKATYCFLYKNVYVSIYCIKDFEKIIEDAIC